MQHDDSTDEFASLHQVLASMASVGLQDLAAVDGASVREVREQQAWSDAAGRLFAVLHNGKTSGLRWFAWDDEIRQWIESPGVRDEGLQILRYVAGWMERAAQQHLQNVEEWSAILNLELSKQPSTAQGRKRAKGHADETFRPAVWVDGGKYTRAQEFFRKDHIGFARSEIVAFMGQQKIGHDFLRPLKTERQPAYALEHSPKQQALSSGEIAYVFRDIHFRDWKGRLDDPAGWLESCRIDKGLKGKKGTQARWDPIKIAIALSTAKRITDNHGPKKRRDLLGQRFATEALLEPFRTEWAEFCSTMFDNSDV